MHIENLSEYENIELNERAKEMIKKMNDFRDDISGKVYEYNLFQQVDFNMKTLYGENNYEEDIETTIYKNFIRLLEDVFYKRETVSDAIYYYTQSCSID